MMNFKKNAWLFGILILLSSKVFALECDVKYRAEKIITKDTWYGKIEHPVFRSGVVSGVGTDRKACQRDALSELKQEGWSITFHRIVNIKRERR